MAHTLADSESRRIGVDAVVSKYRGILFDAAGLIEFGPMLLLFVRHGSERSAIEWIAVVGCLGLWLVARFATREPVRFAIMTGAGLLLLAVPLILASSGAPAFVPVTTISYAIVLAGIFAFRARWAVLVLLTTSSLQVLNGLDLPPAAFLPAGTLDIQLGVLLCVIGGSGILLSRIQYVRLWRRSDARTRRAFKEAARAQRETERLHARTASERRIHETVLNTLTAVAMGVGIDRPEDIREACALDLQQLDRISPPLPQPTASAAIEAALEAVSAYDVRCEVIGGSTDALDMFTAWALRDAVTESLINVARHAGVDRATVTISSALDTTVTIRDEGRGMTLPSREGFGVSTSIRKSMSDVGGEASIESTPGQGTTVVLRVPHRRSQGNLPPEPRLLDASLSLSARLGLLGSLIVLTLGAPLMTQSLGAEFLLTALSAGCLAMGIALGFAWSTRARVPLALANVGLLALLYLYVSRTQMTCATEPAIAWLVALAGGGGMLLAMLAPISQGRRLAVIGAVSLLGGILLMQVPGQCRAPSFLPLATNAAYLISVWLVMRWGESTFVRERDAAIAARLNELARTLETERATASLDGWSKVDPETRDFLRSIANQVVDPASESSQVMAGRLATAVRSRIGLMDQSSRPAGLIETLSEWSHVSDGSVRVDHLSGIEYDAPLPNEIHGLLHEIVMGDLVDPITIHVHESAGTQVIVARTTWEAIHLIEDSGLPEVPYGYEISVLRDPEEPTIACLLIERGMDERGQGSSPA